MKILEWLKKGEEESKVPITANEFIAVSFVLYYDIKEKASIVKKVAEDMNMVICNTTGIVNSKNEFLGCTNPYLGINQLMTYGSTKELTATHLRKFFFPKVTNVKSEWKIVIAPHPKDLYSLPDLYHDMFLLVQSNRWILERHNIEVYSKGEGMGSFNINIINNQPYIEFRDPLFNFQYSVNLRMQEYEKFPGLDKIVFGEDFYQMIKRIRKENKNLKLNTEQKEWWVKVDKLLENKK